MENIVLIAVEKDENDNLTLVFFNPNDNTVTYTDLNNNQRTVKINRKIKDRYKHIFFYKFECFQKRLKKINKVLNYTLGAALVIALAAGAVSFGSELRREYKKWEKIDKNMDEDRTDYIIGLINKKIDENDTYTTAQREFLKQKVTEYFELSAEYYNYESVSEAERLLEKTYINYEEYNESALGDTDLQTGEINLYLINNSWGWGTLFHEHLHQMIATPYYFMEEYLVYAMCDKLVEQNENPILSCISNQYLLLLSQIIGQDEVLRVFVNAEEYKLPQLIAEATGINLSYADTVISNMETIMEQINKNEYDESTFTLMDTTTKELVQLAAMAKNIDYKDDFLLSALYNKDYYVDSFFMDPIVLKNDRGITLYVQEGLDEDDLLHIEAKNIIKKLYNDYKTGTITKHDEYVFNEIITLCDDSLVSIASDMSTLNIGDENSFTNLVMSHIATRYFPVNISDADKFICELYYREDYQYNAYRIYCMLFETKYVSEFSKKDVADIKKINDDAAEMLGLERRKFGGSLRILETEKTMSLYLQEVYNDLKEKYPEEFMLLESSNLEWENKDLLYPVNSKLIDEENVYVYQNVSKNVETVEDKMAYTYFINPFPNYESALLQFYVNEEQKQDASRMTMEINGNVFEDVFVVDIDDTEQPNTLKTRSYNIGWKATVIVSYQEYLQKQNNATLTKTIDSE